MTNQRCQIFIPKSIIFSSSSPTLFFLLFTSLFPPFSQYQKMGGTWEELGRNLGGTWEERFRVTFVTSLLSNRYQSEVLSKTKRSSIEHLSKIYRTSIEDLSNIYRRPIEESVCQLFYPLPYGLSDATKNGHIAKYLLFDK